MSNNDKVKTCLWFDTQAEEAANFYTSLFDDGKVLDVARNGDAVMLATFELGGRQFMALNGGAHVSFTDAVSIYVDCETQEEVDRLWDALTANGGEPGQCGWLKDRFGVSWQIIPSAVGECLGHPDPAKAQRAMEAMMPMGKIDIATLRAAVA